MKKEDFDEIKAFCNEKGFELLNVDHEDNQKFYVIAVKKDLWEGVEFARYKFQNHLQLAFFKVKETKGEYLIPENGGELFKGNCDPITEQAYIEQLKKEANERFGEIKEGDRFDLSQLGGNANVKFRISTGQTYKHHYNKESDTLFVNSFGIYKQGKWAIKLQNRVEAKLTGHPTWVNNKSNGYDFCFHFKTINGGENLETHKAGQFLASCLEKYLNDEIKSN